MLWKSKSWQPYAKQSMRAFGDWSLKSKENKCSIYVYEKAHCSMEEARTKHTNMKHIRDEDRISPRGFVRYHS